MPIVTKEEYAAHVESQEAVGKCVVHCCPVCTGLMEEHFLSLIPKEPVDFKTDFQLDLSDWKKLEE